MFGEKYESDARVWFIFLTGLLLFEFWRLPTETYSTEMGAARVWGKIFHLLKDHIFDFQKIDILIGHI